VFNHSLMKKILVVLISFLFSIDKAQTYPNQNISLISIIAPNTDTIPSPVGNKYSGCWGWYQASKSKEYAISGASGGTYFIDITNPLTPTVSAFVSGRKGCTWRELKTYKNYCYIASDDGKPNTFQIVDMQYLPDSVHVINNSNTLLERGHTLWVDSNKLYVGGVTFSAGGAPMAIFSLATPSAPLLIKKLNDDIGPSIINYVHDMHARNDTIYASTGNGGLYVLKHDLVNDTLTVLGSYVGYSGSGYNHSSFLTKDSKYLMFCDEVPGGLPIHVVNVQNLANIQPISSFYPQPFATAHNPYMIGNKFALVSCYQDGLFIYDISQPQTIKQVGFFDTYPQGGANVGNYGGSPYNGNWGVYPYLPSGRIVANDMQNGVFILNASVAYTTTNKTDVNSVGIKQENLPAANLLIYPNPAKNMAIVSYNTSSETLLQIKNVMGQLVYSKTFSSAISEYINVEHFDRGIYFVSIKNAYQNTVKKIEVIH
jgi:choice-of-anchor B domain-containing protein